MRCESNLIFILGTKDISIWDLGQLFGFLIDDLEIKKLILRKIIYKPLYQLTNNSNNLNFFANDLEHFQSMNTPNRFANIP